MVPMFNRFKFLFCFALMAIAMSASAFIPERNLLPRQDAKTQSTQYEYDSLNRLTNVTHETDWKASFKYDANGNMVTQASPLASSSFSYDTMNRLSSSLISVNSRSFAVTNSYDANGNRTNIVYPGNKVLKYAYDAENRLASVDLSAFSASSVVQFKYDSASHLTNIVYPNGVNGTFVSDANGRITEFGYSRNSSNILRRAIARNLLGYKTQEDIYAGPIPNFTNGLRQTRTYNDADQMLSAGETTYSYDDKGNLTAAAGLTYAWDYNNRLTGISGQGSVSYIYDASGARIGRVADGVTNYFILDFQSPLKQPLCETDGSGQITRYYIWSSHGLLAHLDMNPTNGVVVATRYYHCDELGSTLALTDDAGVATDQFTYSPYGEVLSHTGTNSTPYQWSGAFAVRNEGNGLYYMLNRYYSADQKRFLSPDPLGIDGGGNLYAYGELNPLAFVDPFGLCAETFKSGSSGWDNFTSGLASEWQQLTQGQPQSTYSQSSFQYNPSTVSYAQSSFKYVTPSGSQQSMGSTVYNAAINVTGAKALTQAITGYGVNNDGSYNFSQTYTANQRIGQAALGTFQAATFVWGSAELGAMGGQAFSSSSRALTSSRLPSSGALATSRITNPSQMLPAPSAVRSSPVVIGEQMTRVNSYARNIGGHTIDDWLAGRRWSPPLNDEFISTMKAQGRDFIDIGPAFGRRLQNRIDPVFGRPPSTVYGGEHRQLLNYNNYKRVYERTGKYQGGVPGFDF